MKHQFIKHLDKGEEMGKLIDKLAASDTFYKVAFIFMAVNLAITIVCYSIILARGL